MSTRPKLRPLRLVVALGVSLMASGCATPEPAPGVATAAPSTPAPLPEGTLPYPLDNCLVNGRKFEHGPPYVFAYQGRELKLCCKRCLEDFNRKPALYLERLRGL